VYLRSRVRAAPAELFPEGQFAALDQTIVATALPTIAGDLHGLSDLS
jgi:hypothetical protein